MEISISKLTLLYLERDNRISEESRNINDFCFGVEADIGGIGFLRLPIEQ